MATGRRTAAVLRRAEEMGLIPAESSGESADDRLARLVSSGKLSERTIQDLEDDLGPDGGGLEQRFVIGERLGGGSVTAVHAARDELLGRPVAVKLFPAGRDVAREARAQARVEHPGVCKVYETGELDGKPFIAMQLIAGKPLDAAAAEMTLAQKIDVAIVVADAVQAAHALGLVHRDLKPGNILVERRDGGFQPYVTDFGLALDLGAGDILNSGQPIGTPAYMAPEQAYPTARKIDARTDVYGLGATFYCLFGGQPPYTGTTAEVYRRLVTGAPPPLVGLPRDLVSVVGRAMEGAPWRRYPTAAALAADLRRLRDGLPVAARPSLVGRAWRWIGQHQALSVGVATGVLAVVTNLVIQSQRWGRGAHAEDLARFAAPAAEIERDLARAYTAPLHDVAAERAEARARLAILAAQVDAAGPAARGPGELALGRAALALHDYDAARAHLDRAVAAREVSPDLAYAYGKTLAHLYQRELGRLQRIESEEARAARAAELEASLGTPALESLSQASGAATIEDPELVRGMMALLDRRFLEAAEIAEQTFTREPWLYEAKLLAGDAHLGAARNCLRVPDYKCALGQLGCAGEDYQAALAVGRSDPALYLAECQRLVQLAAIDDLAGNQPDATRERALVACAQAAAADSTSPLPLIEESRVLLAQAIHDRRHDDDLAGDERTRQAIDRAERALALDPDSVDALALRARARRNQLERAQFSGGDPGPATALAVADLERVLAITPGDDATRLELAIVHNRRAAFQQTQNLEPRAEVAAAQALLLPVIQRHPEWPNGFHEIVFGLEVIGSYEHGRGGAWTLWMAAAIEAASRAIAADPAEWRNWYTRGSIENEYSNWEQDNDLALLVLGRAIDDYHRAMETNPLEPAPLVELSAMYGNLAGFLGSVGMDPYPLLATAIAGYRKVLARYPRLSGAWVNLGFAETLLARHLLAPGPAPDAEVAAAREALDRALELDPHEIAAMWDLCDLETLVAPVAIAAGADPTAGLDRCRVAVGKAIAYKLGNAGIYVMAASERRWRAEWLLVGHASATDIAAEIDAGLGFARTAVELNPAEPGALLQAELELLAMAAATDPHARRAAAGRAIALVKQLRGDPAQLAARLGPRLAEAVKLTP
jgi:serine/threonine-protein kinase